MNMITTPMSIFICLLAVVSVAKAQQIPTTEDLEKAQAIRSGTYRRPISEEQRDLYRQKEEERTRTLANARKAYQQGKYSVAAAIYETIPDPQYPFENWELAESYASSGDTEKALIAYRKALYQVVKLRDSKHYDLTPRAILPYDAVTLDDARERYPDSEIEVWSDKSPLKLGRYALMLVRNNENKEAISVYTTALQNVSVVEWRTALSLGSISIQNFDVHRFESATYALIAAGIESSGIEWRNLTGQSPEKGRSAELEKAIRVKPDYAPALYIKADAITRIGGRKTREEYNAAKISLDKAQQFARSDKLRALVQKLRNDYSDRLQ